jgi:hypothetical protein
VAHPRAPATESRTLKLAYAAAALFSLLAIGAWYITALVFGEGILAADIIAIGVALALTFVAVVAWRDGRNT